MQEGSKLTWKVPTMNKGETKTMKVRLKADREGELTGCATITSIPRVCVTTIVGKPAISIDKTGPEYAKLGDNITYTIVVRNTGSAVANSVVITDTVSDGLAHSSGQKTLTFAVGDLAPGASKTQTVVLKAMERGKFCNVAEASSSNAGKVKDDACTIVQKPGVSIVKTGTKEQFLTRTASYEITVSNSGDTTLNNVVVTDTAPAATSIVQAPGATVAGKTATWTLATLAPKETKKFNVTLTSATPGSHCNGVAVATAGGLRDSAEACTVWRGISALLLEKGDNSDPIQIGEETTYYVRVTNQGTAADSDVKVVVEFPGELTPTSASNGGQINGQTVTFPSVSSLAPKAVFEYTIKAKGVKAGDARVRFIRTSKDIPAPTTAEESTRIY